MHRFLVERQSRADILGQRPACAGEMNIPSSDAYLQQIANLDLPGLWSRLKVEILHIYGSADYLTSAEEDREIADTLNAARQGSATFIKIPDLGHFMTQARGQQEASHASRRFRRIPPGFWASDYRTVEG